MTKKVMAAIEDCGSAIDFIPAGYTSKLQTMDVGLNKPFKDYLREKYEEWMVAENGTKKQTDRACRIG